jgi:hypothetical protein
MILIRGDKMKKFKVLVIIFSFVLIFLTIGCESKEKKEIAINILDEDNKVLYSENVKTKKDYLLDLLLDLPVDVKYKNINGSDNTYITSLLNVEEKIDDSSMYYWTFYVDDESTTESINNIELKDGATYKFNYEKAEY